MFGEVPLLDIQNTKLTPIKMLLLIFLHDKNAII